MKTIQIVSKKLAGSSILIAATALFGFAISSSAQVVTQAASNPTLSPNTSEYEIGPTLDVVPIVLSDGYTINLTLIPALIEFDGYDTPPVVPGVAVANLINVPTVLPRFTVRQVVTTVNIWDNQTIGLGGLISSSIQTTKDKVPFLGDLPLLGRLFQSQSKSSVKKNLMIFVTATIIDPAGNRVHTDDELPFAQVAVPAQPAGAGVVNDLGSKPIAPPIVR